MPKISITPVNLFKLEIDVAEIPDTSMKWEFMDIVDNLTLPHVGPNDFWDGADYDTNTIYVNHPIDGDQVSDFICKVSAEYEKFKLAKGF